MKAIGALSRVQPPPLSLPQKFIPIDERDRWLLAWLDEYAAHTGSAIDSQLCEIYASAVRVEFGKPLAARCLGCHAGRSPAAFSINDACAECHAAIYAQWTESAHAQSLSHLHLATPNPARDQVVWMDFGEVHGINCTECHPVSGQRSAATATAGVEGPPRCAYEFAAGEAAASSCARCHASSHAEWLAWRDRPHPRRPEWPPGQVDLDVRDDERTCMDCHMVSSHGGPRDHRWAARRDREMLRAAVDVRVQPPGDGHDMCLVVTNLAGHAFPTGTRRRAIRFHAGPAAGDLPLVLTLSTDAVEGAGGTVLSPGEQRFMSIPLPTGAQQAAYRVVYIRDHRNPQSYTADIVSGSYRLPGAGPDWPGPGR